MSSHNVVAQSPANILSGERQDTVTLQTDPRFPEPHEEVTVTAQGNEFLIDDTSVAWTVNGKLVREGVGIDSITLTAGEVGEPTQVSVTILKRNGDAVNESVVIKPTQIDLIWEADSYTPPFYKGKALRAPTGNARVVALVRATDQNGNIIPTEDLFFKWIFNGRPLVEFSGYGENIFPSDVSPRRNTVAVEISTRNGRSDMVTREEITIPNRNPEILLYKRTPLGGVNYAEALDESTQIQTEEVTFVAEPYYFDMKNMNIGGLNYIWSLNGDEVAGNSNNQIKLRKTDQVGAVELSVEALHPKKRQQQIIERINVLIPGQE